MLADSQPHCSHHFTGLRCFEICALHQVNQEFLPWHESTSTIPQLWRLNTSIAAAQASPGAEAAKANRRFSPLGTHGTEMFAVNGNWWVNALTINDLREIIPKFIGKKMLTLNSWHWWSVNWWSHGDELVKQWSMKLVDKLVGKLVDVLKFLWEWDVGHNR